MDAVPGEMVKCVECGEEHSFGSTNHVCYNKTTEDPDLVNPNHYKQGSKEVIDEMREMSTLFEFQQYCRLTALKYLKRSAHKGNFPQDMAKAAWYCQMAAHVEEPSKYKDPRTL